MSISLKSYGYLPQLQTFDGYACVPTAAVNTMTAMARTYQSLRNLISTTGDFSYKNIADKRDILATRYFYTSNDWPGTPGSLIIRGLQNYAGDIDLAQRLEVKFIGPDINSKQGRLIGNYGTTDTIKIMPPSLQNLEQTITTPDSTDPIVQRSYHGSGATIHDIQKALVNGDGLLLGLLYDNGGGGHMVSAVSLNWNDRNANGIAEADENALLTVIDPLHPSKNYTNATPGKVNNQQKFYPLVEARGPVRSTVINLVSDQQTSEVEFRYEQYSIGFDTKTGRPEPRYGDSSNGTTSKEITGTIPFLAILKARENIGKTFKGGSGDNVIELDPGRDRIIGGKGSDVFVISDPKSLKKGKSDEIIDFKSNQDLIVLSEHGLGIEEIDIAYTSKNKQTKLSKKSDQTLVYQQKENYGFLYFNSNGDDPGWGNQGGEIIRLKGAPDLTQNDLFIGQ